MENLEGQYGNKETLSINDDWKVKLKIMINGVLRRINERTIGKSEKWT